MHLYGIIMEAKKGGGSMKLKEIRKQKGFTQKQVADYLECNPYVYSRYESETREPPIDVLIKLSRFLGVSIDTIVGNDYTPEDGGLSTYEVALLRAAQMADERAREDALNLLQAHSTAKK